MTLLEQLNTALAPLDIPIETGIFSEAAPDEYIVIVPLSDTYDVHADNQPQVNIEEARIALFSKNNYTTAKNAIVRTLLAGEFTITARHYIGFETETGYHHYNVDVAQYYEMEES